LLSSPFERKLIQRFDADLSALQLFGHLLDAPHREVILLRKFEDLSFKEIAARMGRSEDACRMLLARALAALTIELHRQA